jgi:hypothetical protein
LGIFSGPEQATEGVIITGIKGLLKAAQLILVEAAVGVAVKAVAQQLDDVGVVTKRPRRQPLELLRQKRAQCLIDRRSGSVGHDRNVTDPPGRPTAIPPPRRRQHQH